MAIPDKVTAAVTPLENDEARDAASADDRLAQIPGHHEQIEAAFAAVAAANDVTGRQAAQTELTVRAGACANAEQAVIVQALIRFDHEPHGTCGHAEQAGAKANLGNPIARSIYSR